MGDVGLDGGALCQEAQRVLGDPAGRGRCAEAMRGVGDALSLLVVRWPPSRPWWEGWGTVSGRAGGVGIVREHGVAAGRPTQRNASRRHNVMARSLVARVQVGLSACDDGWRARTRRPLLSFLGAKRGDTRGLGPACAADLRARCGAAADSALDRCAPRMAPPEAECGAWRLRKRPPFPVAGWVGEPIPARARSVRAPAHAGWAARCGRL